MADPEEIYAQVLSEEQGKGSAAPVAEGRAKAARARAEAGSPHPKEAKWWPGAQPHLEGGGEAPAETDEAEAPQEPAAAADEPAAEAEEPAAAATPAATEEPAAATPQEEPAAPAAPVVPAAATASVPVAETAAPAAAAEAAPEQKPSGVTHGTADGNRMRPEDGVATEAQLQGQADMYTRRKLIDEMISTGVPVISAHETGEKRSPALALLYLLIPIMAIVFLLANDDSTPAGGEGPTPPETGVVLSAANVAFDTDSVTVTAGEPATVTLDNEDSVEHNFSIYEDDSAEADLFTGQNVAAGSTIDYEVPALDKGEYFFRCDLHPSSMTGTVTAE